jgi:hypothetical protein
LRNSRIILVASIGCVLVGALWINRNIEWARLNPGLCRDAIIQDEQEAARIAEKYLYENYDGPKIRSATLKELKRPLSGAVADSHWAVEFLVIHDMPETDGNGRPRLPGTTTVAVDSCGRVLHATGSYQLN